MHNLSKYTIPTSFAGIAVPTKVVGMLVVLALPTKVVGMQASTCLPSTLLDPRVDPGVHQGQPCLTPGLTLGSSRVDPA